MNKLFLWILKWIGIFKLVTFKFEAIQFTIWPGSGHWIVDYQRSGEEYGNWDQRKIKKEKTWKQRLKMKRVSSLRAASIHRERDRKEKRESFLVPSASLDCLPRQSYDFRRLESPFFLFTVNSLPIYPPLFLFLH